LVFLAEANGTDAMLFLMVRPAEADPESIMRLSGDTGIRGAAKVREFYPRGGTIGNAAAVRPDPLTMTWPHCLHWGSRAHF
jgi:hypothetical protein